MKINTTAITRSFSRHILQMKKSSPKMLFVVGIAGVVGSTILACRATLKLDNELNMFNADINKAKEVEVDDNRKHLAYVYMKGSANIIKLYAPSIVIGSAAIGALAYSHVTLSRRNTYLTAAYTAVQQSFDAYRERVKKEIGEERELQLRHAIDVKSVEVDGKMKEVEVANPNKWSPYARFFDEESVQWRKEASLNKLFLEVSQNYANHRLNAHGHLFLNEVYDMLGLSRTSAGQIVGWVIGDADNFVDFGIYQERNSQFIDGIEPRIILDFNVDGPIWDKI